MASSLDQEATQESDNENRPQKGPQSDWMNGLQVGDLVWGKVKSHPWWPGHIFDESFAGNSVRKTRLAEGRKPNSVLVAFFGDSSYGWFDPSELIPFAPNFPEMSMGANHKSFINAVSEASDEASRRGALAVTCKCRDESNFAPTGVDNYFFVDVPGYEQGGIYSLGQIEEARKLFNPAMAALFVSDLALGPIDSAAAYSIGEDVVTFMKMRAMMVGYRRAVFEERDETYAQAFGVDPAKSNRSVGLDTHLQKKQERFTQRAVPLSGELKIAETSPRKENKIAETHGGSNKKRPASSSSSYASAKTPKSKQKPKPLSQIQHQPRFKSTPSKKTAAIAATNDDDKYLLKRRDDAGPNTIPSSLPDLQYPLPTPDLPDTSFLVNPAAEQTDVGGAKDSYVLQKRERKEEGEEKEKKPVKEKPLQKRKKLEGQSSAEPGVKSEGGEGSLEKKRKKKKKKKKPVDFSSMDLDTPQIVSDLQKLALEPLYGEERDAAAPVKYLVLNFRSAVYQKSLVNQAASGKSDVAKAEKLKVKKEKGVLAAMASKPLGKKQGLKRPNDSSLIQGTGAAPSPSVIGRKRGPSDRQEELNVKKQKKMDKIKALAIEKKAALANASKVNEEEKKKEIKVQKPEQPPAPKIPSATALMMKFPLKTALPTIATLKAKLARFGPIDLSNTRVYWNSHMCKVTFRFKDDAKAALNYVNSNEIFGQSKVQYYIRELDPPSSQEAKTDSRALVEPVSVRPESRTGPEPIETRPRPPLVTQPPKSILKKPGEDTGASAGTANGPRVTFLLDRTNSKITRPELPPSMAIGGDGGSVTNKSAALPPPPPLVSRPPLVHPTRPPFDLRRLPPPPPLLAARPGSAQWTGEWRLAHEPVAPGPYDPVQSTRNGPFGGFEERKKEEVDISGHLLGLLRQCSDIVAKVKNSLGYMPYHPL